MKKIFDQLFLGCIFFNSISTYSMETLPLPKGYTFQPTTLKALKCVQEELQANRLSLEILHLYQPQPNQLKKRPDTLLLRVMACGQNKPTSATKQHLLSALLNCAGFVPKMNGQWVSYSYQHRADLFQVEGLSRLP